MVRDANRRVKVPAAKAGQALAADDGGPGVGRADMASKMLLFGTAAVLAFVHIQPGSLTVQCMRHLACSRSLQGRKLWNAFKVRGATRASTREHYSGITIILTQRRRRA